VYSRSTLKHIVAFPPRGPARDTAALGFALSLSEDFKAVPDAERLSVTPTGPDGVRADVSRAVLHGTYRPSDNDDNTNMEDGFDEAVRRAIAMHPIRLRPDQDAEIEYGFTACHFTPTDLVCTTRSGAVFIVRSYAAVFRAAISLPEDGDERAKLVAQNTIIIGLGTTIRQLTTFGYHIVLCTVSYTSL
jgi:hypothetical protein